MRHAFLAIVLATAALPLASADPTCVDVLRPCDVVVDPDASDPVSYDLGGDPPPTGCDEGDDCCDGCSFQVLICTPDGALVEVSWRVRGGTGVPVADVWLTQHQECRGVGCDAFGGCAVYEYGRRVLLAHARVPVG